MSLRPTLAATGVGRLLGQDVCGFWGGALSKALEREVETVLGGRVVLSLWRLEGLEMARGRN